MKRFIFSLIGPLILLGNLVFAMPTLAAVNEACIWAEGFSPKMSDILNRAACNAGLTDSYQNNETPTEQSVILIVGNIINVILGFAGVLFTILIIYAGYLWMTARGSEEQAKQAQDYIRNAVIGIIITFAAFAVTQFALLQVVGSIGSGSNF